MVGARRDEALTDLRAWLLRSAQFYLHRQAPQLTALGPEPVAALAEDAARGEDVQELFPAIALHLRHCPSCQDLYDTLVALTASPTG